MSGGTVGVAPDVGSQPVVAQEPPMARSSETRNALDAFYRDLLFELGEFGRRRTATALGAAVVVKRVGLAHDISAASRLPLPRLNRAEREEGLEAEWQAQQ